MPDGTAFARVILVNKQHAVLVGHRGRGVGAVAVLTNTVVL